MLPKLFRISTIPTSLETLLKGQLKMLSEYYEVVAVSSPGEKMKVLEEREGVRTVSISMERRISLVKDFMSLLRLIILFAKERPDMVHSITPKAGLLSMLAAWITRVPVRMHTFTGLVFPTATGKMQKLLIVMDRLTCFCATHINPEGEGVKRDLINYNITSKPLHVIANGNVNGIDLEYFDRTPEVMEKARSYKKEGTFTFCFVGRMVKDKGINELVHSFLRLYQNDARVRLLLVGPFEKELDPVLPEVEEQILHHPGICFMGFQSDVRSFLAASDALVFPSYREGFPNVVIQAGAMGIPAIVTDINGCNEIVLPDRNGMIIPTKNEQALYEAMKYFASHSVEVEKMAANARPLIVSRYEQRMVWNALLTEYKSII
ncbi:glycosyl transferase [Parabacteroides goldsteinii]|uniref:glycosyltransferase family 4 protein n=1 Tax=Bacteroidales TaxID=171549 RepID=UPI0018F6448E|nr:MULTISPECIES: glycosyltransferase family 4 protein [Parabacteroides]GKG75312.1 glycosyl transferase [Parabacteroides goldsteinii]GKG81281.1 glycosyl transferase [Parabacteroides goldsteinii]